MKVALLVTVAWITVSILTVILLGLIVRRLRNARKILNEREKNEPHLRK